MVIVAAIDRSDRSATVVAEAERLAEAFDETVHVVHVVTSLEYTALGRKNAKANDPVSTDQVMDSASEVAEEAAETLSVPSEPVGLLGDLDRRIRARARRPVHRRCRSKAVAHG